jgi:hypothetical protein
MSAKDALKELLGVWDSKREQDGVITWIEFQEYYRVSDRPMPGHESCELSLRRRPSNAEAHLGLAYALALRLTCMCAYTGHQRGYPRRQLLRADDTQLLAHQRGRGRGGQLGVPEGAGPAQRWEPGGGSEERRSPCLVCAIF